jgi:hypothetical protein
MSAAKRVFVCLCLVLTLTLIPLNIEGASKKDAGAVRTAIVKAYRNNFGLEIPFPAYVKAAGPGNTYYYTSSAYIGTHRYRIYLHDDGTVDANVCDAKRPHGIYRVGVVAIDHGNTNIAALLGTLWVEVQQEINDNYAAFSTSHGFAEPVLQFSSTNFLASSSEIANPGNSADIISLVESKGYRQEDFDIFVSLNLDAQNISGGWANYGGNFVYMGYYFSQTTFADLSKSAGGGKSQLFWIGKSIYDHECGHIFGWEHEWTGMGSNLRPDDLITDPSLYGWIDTDGDGVPEIMDPTPYRML